MIDGKRKCTYYNVQRIRDVKIRQNIAKLTRYRILICCSKFQNAGGLCRRKYARLFYIITKK